MQALLEDDQRGFMINPDLHHRMSIDLLSPMLMAAMSAQAMNTDTKENVRSFLTKNLSEKYALSGETLAGAQEGIDAALEELDPFLKPVDPEIPMHLDEAMAAARRADRDAQGAARSAEPRREGPRGDPEGDRLDGPADHEAEGGRERRMRPPARQAIVRKGRVPSA